MANVDISIGFSVAEKKLFAQELRKVGDRVVEALDQALHVEAERIMGTSKEVYVPVETGALRDSGHVQPTKHGADEFYVVMGYGNNAVSYAVWVHEIPPPPGNEPVPGFRRHGAAIGKPPGQQYKFLERPVMESISGMPFRLARSVRKFV
jgi:hypothetical protein